ncbi:MAG: alpha/beta fold hydrolase [bacterium]|nr:alpha/beta fold hydrolase [bacterium]
MSVSRAVFVLVALIGLTAIAYPAGGQGEPPAAAPTTPSDAEGPAAESGFIPVDGGRLFYETAGAGPAVVFLHDGLLDHHSWDEQFAPWSRRYRVIRYDRRGYGRSTLPETPYSHLEDLGTILDALAVPSATVVGASSGGQLAVDFALAHPERVTTLVLVGAVVGGMDYSTHFTARNLRILGPLYQAQDVAATIELLTADPYSTAPESSAVRERVRQILTANPHHLTGPRGLAREPELAALPRLGDLSVPTLIVVGAADIPDVHAHAGALAAGIPGARRVVLPGGGHLVHLEAPEAFNQVVLDFLTPAEEKARQLIDSVPRLAFEELAPLFDYDPQAPLEATEHGSETRGEARVVDLTYASPHGGRVTAYLVLPPGDGPFAAVLFLHPGQGDRSTFVAEAVALAARGVVSLSIDAPFRRPGETRSGGFFNPENSRAMTIQTVVDLRRAVELLRSRPEVDPERIAYVGHSLGATFGGVLAGLEARLAGYVLMAGYPATTHSWRKGEHGIQVAFRHLLTAEQQAHYLELHRPLDALHYVHGAAPAPILFQFATRDEFITEADALAYFQVASEPKQIEWYDTDHFFNEEAQEKRLRWLTEVLSLGD